MVYRFYYFVSVHTEAIKAHITFLCSTYFFTQFISLRFNNMNSGDRRGLLALSIALCVGLRLSTFFCKSALFSNQI